MAEPAKSHPLIKRQAPMETVLLALAPALAAAVYFYGWRALAVVAATNAAALATEWAFTHRRGEPVTMAVFVTGSLLALSLPPNIPYWIAVVGAVFAVAVGKELFGGFARNVFNPALVGRAFIFVSFPIPMTGSWFEPFTNGAGGLAHYASVDAVTTATPLALMAKGGAVPLLSLVTGTAAGSLGEGCAIALILGGAYMVYKRVASWEIILSVLATYAVGAFGCAALGLGASIAPLPSLFAGALLYGAIFMATDPVSAVASRQGKVAYGMIIGFSVLLIRYFGNFPEGVMFSILLGNTFGPIVEMGLKEWSAKRAKGAAA